MTDQVEQELRTKWQHLVFNLLGGSSIEYTMNPIGTTNERKKIADQFFDELMQLIAQAHKGYEPYREKNGRYDYSDMSLQCVCGHPLSDHLADSPRACGLYGTGLNDCPCEKFKKSRAKKLYTQADIDRAVEEAERKTLEAIKERIEDYPPFPVCTQNSLTKNCKHTDCAVSRAINETIDAICKASHVTLTPPHNPTQETK